MVPEFDGTWWNYIPCGKHLQFAIQNGHRHRGFTHENRMVIFQFVTLVTVSLPEGNRNWFIPSYEEFHRIPSYNGWNPNWRLEMRQPFNQEFHSIQRKVGDQEQITRWNCESWLMFGIKKQTCPRKHEIGTLWSFQSLDIQVFQREKQQMINKNKVWKWKDGQTVSSTWDLAMFGDISSRLLRTLSMHKACGWSKMNAAPDGQFCQQRSPVSLLENGKSCLSPRFWWLKPLKLIKLIIKSQLSPSFESPSGEAAHI